MRTITVAACLAAITLCSCATSGRHCWTKRCQKHRKTFGGAAWAGNTSGSGTIQFSLSASKRAKSEDLKCKFDLPAGCDAHCAASELVNKWTVQVEQAKGKACKAELVGDQNLSKKVHFSGRDCLEYAYVACLCEGEGTKGKTPVPSKSETALPTCDNLTIIEE